MNAEDATVLERGSCQLEAWTQRLPDHREYWAAPSCGVAQDWELGAAYVRTRAPHADGSSHLGGVYAKALWRPLTTNDWGIGLVLAHLPVAAGSMAGDTTLNVPLSVSLRDDAVLVHANLGWTRHYAIQQGGATWGLGAEFAVHPRAALTLETFGSGRGHGFVQAGARYSVIPNRLDVDAAYGQRLRGGDRQQFVSLGLTWVALLAK